MQAVRKPRLKAYERELMDAGYPVDVYHRAQRFFSDRGISLRYGKAGEWIVGGIDYRQPGCCYRIGRIGTGALIEYLDAPSTLLATFGK